MARPVVKVKKPAPEWPPGLKDIVGAHYPPEMPEAGSAEWWRLFRDIAWDYMPSRVRITMLGASWPEKEAEMRTHFEEKGYPDMVVHWERVKPKAVPMPPGPEIETKEWLYALPTPAPKPAAPQALFSDAEWQAIITSPDAKAVIAALAKEGYQPAIDYQKGIGAAPTPTPEEGPELPPLPPYIFGSRSEALARLKQEGIDATYEPYPITAGTYEGHFGVRSKVAPAALPPLAFGTADEGRAALEKSGLTDTFEVVPGTGELAGYFTIKAKTIEEPLPPAVFTSEKVALDYLTLMGMEGTHKVTPIGSGNWAGYYTVIEKVSKPTGPAPSPDLWTDPKSGQQFWKVASGWDETLGDWAYTYTAYKPPAPPAPKPPGETPPPKYLTDEKGVDWVGISEWDEAAGDWVITWNVAPAPPAPEPYGGKTFATKEKALAAAGTGQEPDFDVDKGVWYLKGAVVTPPKPTGEMPAPTVVTDDSGKKWNKIPLGWNPATGDWDYTFEPVPVEPSKPTGVAPGPTIWTDPATGKKFYKTPRGWDATIGDWAYDYELVPEEDGKPKDYASYDEALAAAVEGFVPERDDRTGRWYVKPVAKPPEGQYKSFKEAEVAAPEGWIPVHLPSGYWGIKEEWAAPEKAGWLQQVLSSERAQAAETSRLRVDWLSQLAALKSAPKNWIEAWLFEKAGMPEQVGAGLPGFKVPSWVTPEQLGQISKAAQPAIPTFQSALGATMPVPKWLTSLGVQAIEPKTPITVPSAQQYYQNMGPTEREGLAGYTEYFGQPMETLLPQWQKGLWPKGGAPAAPRYPTAFQR